MAHRRPTSCAEPERHKAIRRAETDVEDWLTQYAAEHNLTSMDLLTVLAYVVSDAVRYADRDDEEHRTGFRHRLAGE